jgi:hypothetical protein
MLTYDARERSLFPDQARGGALIERGALSAREIDGLVDSRLKRLRLPEVVRVALEKFDL